MSKVNTFCGCDKIKEYLSKENPHVHFSGAGGVGMYSLVCLARDRGMCVSASDRVRGEFSKMLEVVGVRVSYRPDFKAVSASSLVVYSLALDERDEELVYAASLGIPLVSRADFLSYLMTDYKMKIAVLGTHGKSTTTAMLCEIFSMADLFPTVVCGARLSSGEPLLRGKNDYFMYEACEYKNSFLAMTPSVSCVTNIEYDHPDFFKSEEEVRASFIAALNRTSELAFLPSNDKNARKIFSDIGIKCLTWGAENADYEYSIKTIGRGGADFILRRGGLCENFRINIIGGHNIANAALAATVSLELGVDAAKVRGALKNFKAPSRRLETIGEYRGRRVLYDYAHHPTEISAAISAQRAWSGEAVTVIFKPHTFSRTRALWDGFVRALSLADNVILADIYPAREEPIYGVNSRRLAEDIGERAAYAEDENELMMKLDDTVGSIIIMGAGELDSVKDRILRSE